MKVLLVTTFLVLSFSSRASTKKCHYEVSQAEKTECMSYEKDRAIGRFMSEVTEQCAEKKDISESKGGSIYPMLLEECMAKKLDKITNDLRKE